MLQTWVQIPSLPLFHCVTMGRSPHLSELCIGPFASNGPERLIWGFTKKMHKMWSMGLAHRRFSINAGSDFPHFSGKISHKEETFSVAQ